MTSIYDSPDGKDCLKKTAEGTMVGAKLGFLWGLADMIALTRPNTVAGVVKGSLYYTVPAAAALGTFHATSCLLGDMRGKDTAANHMIAGAVSASLLGARYGPKFAFYASIPAALLAGVCKQVKLDGFDLINSQPIYKQYGRLHHYERTFGPRKEVEEPTNY